MTAPSARAWAPRQARRLVWLVQDLLLGARSLGHVLRHARAADHRPGLALLEGGSWAVRGTLNAYRIRMVNDTAPTLHVTFVVRGEAAPGARFEARRADRLPGREAREIYLVTDWVARFEITTEAPAIDPVGFLGARAAAGSCRLTATLETGETVDVLGIVQPLAG